MLDTHVSAGNPLTTPLEELQTHFDLDAGRACLDFVNSLRDRNAAKPREFLPDYADLIAFSRATEHIDGDAATALMQQATADPEAARAALDAARALREALYRIFSATAAEQQPDDAAIAVFNRLLHAEAARRRFTAQADHYQWTYPDHTDLYLPLWPLVHEAAGLLLGDERTRLRECAADDCGWIFIDTSRNRSRRWCSMSSCGNRAKVQQFRQRQRSEQ
jgi:predicted RNA-binding Zn ribbon-like protein